MTNNGVLPPAAGGFFVGNLGRLVGVKAWAGREVGSFPVAFCYNPAVYPILYFPQKGLIGL